MNATRTHETGAQRTNDGKGRHTYQPELAAACEGCESLVYRTQTLDWELDSIIPRAKACQYPGSKGAKPYARGRCALNNAPVVARV